MKYLKFLLPLAIFLGLVGFLMKGLSLDPREVPSPLINKPAPAFALDQLDKPGAVIKRDDMLGKVWLLNVFASWCVACREEHPLLVEFSRMKLLPIYGLNYKDERMAGMKWLSTFGNPYEASLYDRDGRVGIDFGVYGVPESFLIDAKGVIRYKQIGPFTPEAIETKLIPLVKQLQKEAGNG
ncbi:DsbE family thiol:disulfide interchange protein [Rhodoferax lacus]|uniref:DsbE family thiol:disulfide interchange protein n=1 Tax=Rhodoferax lacus TaxID=2184758 RepID=A0A3E1R8K8_9BURK|nr:DsbE family thiol:disulfide interchange protein [Rhodoferax lacus]RFO95372.1 DsbE family thiol:disulfide interchange protein [Rhodoferax lacus]